jgi:hypothetical protein
VEAAGAAEVVEDDPANASAGTKINLVGQNDDLRYTFFCEI